MPSNLTSKAQPLASHGTPERASIGETKRGSCSRAIGRRLGDDLAWASRAVLRPAFGPSSRSRTIRGAMSTAHEGEGGTVLLCFDGSEPARQAIERAGLVLRGRSAVVLTVWESVGSAILRHAPSGATELGREAREIGEDVVEELDSRTAGGALATATEGAALSGLTTMLLGSVSYGVVHNSTRPVLIVPPHS